MVSVSWPEATAAVIGATLVGLMWIRRELQLKRRNKERLLQEKELLSEEHELARQNEGMRLRREKLIERYGSIEVVDFIVAGRIWQGMSTEQLVEAWGQPDDLDEKVFKLKTAQTWKYDEVGKNRYSRRVFVENDLVVGWQE